MLSLTRFASSSAKSLRSRSAGVSFWGGWRTAESGSGRDWRLFGSRGIIIAIVVGRDGGKSESGRLCAFGKEKLYMTTKLEDKS